VKFTWDINWQLPRDGKLEFDFIYFGNRPLNENEETQDFHKIIDWFKQREWSHAAHKTNPTESSDHEARATPDPKAKEKEDKNAERKKRPRQTDGAALARVWKSIADLFTISSE
jgi:hypothetical protein